MRAQEKQRDAADACCVAGCKTNEPTGPHPCFPSTRREKVLVAVLFFTSGSSVNSFLDDIQYMNESLSSE